MSLFSRAGRALSALLFNAPVSGVAYMVVATLYSTQGPLVPADELLLGRSAKEISSYVAVRFADEIRRIEVAFGALAAAAGLALGVLALAVLVLRDAAQERADRRRTGPRAALESLGVVVILHAGLMAASMANWPQLYSPAFYAKEGTLARVQTFVTDRLGPGGAAGTLALALTLVIFGAPWRWPARHSRALAALRVRPVRVVGVAAIALGVVAARSGGGVDAPIRRALERPAPRAAGVRSRPNVLVLAADGLRFDRLRPDLAPRLSAVADRGTRFERAYVSVPRTMSSWATMLTGLYAHHHGLRSAFPRWDEVVAERETLPARLRSAGYLTAAVADYAGDVFQKADLGLSVVRAPRWDFAGLLWQRGIQRATPLLPFLQTKLARRALPEISDMAVAADPRFVADDAVEVLREARDRPFFIVVFFSTTHFPYAAPAPYFSRYTRRDYAGPFRYEKQVGAGVALYPDADDTKQIRALYDGAVTAIDVASGRILDELVRQGLSDDTIVVVTSDHGETLFENDRWHGHGDHLFGDEGVHIPLAIFDPRVPVARREGAVVSSVDFAPTIFELTGVEPAREMDGRSVAPALRGEPIASRIAFAETELWLGMNPGIPEAIRPTPPKLFELLEVDTDHGTMVSVRREAFGGNLVGRHRMARDERYKLLYLPTAKGVEWRLIDTLTDPDELVDVKDRAPAEAERLREALWSWILEDRTLTRDGDRLAYRGP